MNEQIHAGQLSSTMTLFFILKQGSRSRQSYFTQTHMSLHSGASRDTFTQAHAQRLISNTQYVVSAAVDQNKENKRFTLMTKWRSLGSWELLPSVLNGHHSSETAPETLKVHDYKFKVTKPWIKSVYMLLQGWLLEATRQIGITVINDTVINERLHSTL